MISELKDDEQSWYVKYANYKISKLTSGVELIGSFLLVFYSPILLFGIIYIDFGIVNINITPPNIKIELILMN